MNKDEAGVYFGVFEFGDDPSVVTKIMGVEPTRSWVKGEPISDKLRGVQSHFFGSGVGPRQLIDMEQIIAYLGL